MRDGERARASSHSLPLLSSSSCVLAVSDFYSANSEEFQGTFQPESDEISLGKKKTPSTLHKREEASSRIYPLSSNDSETIEPKIPYLLNAEVLTQLLVTNPSENLPSASPTHSAPCRVSFGMNKCDDTHGSTTIYIYMNPVCL